MGKKKELSQEQIDAIINAYVNEHKSLAESGRAGGTYAERAKTILMENGYKIISKKEKLVARNKAGRLQCDDAYFDTQSHNMAWLLGFLAADGCVYDNGVIINLSSVDREILEKIREELGLTKTIIRIVPPHTMGGYICHEINSMYWTSDRHVEKLAEYSIVPAKTKILKPPYKLSKEYRIDYIRGYFDGDGSVSYLNMKKGPALRWQIASATKEILDFVVDTLEEYGIKRVSVRQRSDTMWEAQYSTTATKQIFKILYTPDSLFLKRKKDHYIEILQRKEESEIKLHETTDPTAKVKG